MKPKSGKRDKKHSIETCKKETKRKTIDSKPIMSGSKVDEIDDLFLSLQKGKCVEKNLDKVSPELTPPPLSNIWLHLSTFVCFRRKKKVSRNCLLRVKFWEVKTTFLGTIQQLEESKTSDFIN
jgi:hypothetical protein